MWYGLAAFSIRILLDNRQSTRPHCLSGYSRYSQVTEGNMIPYYGMWVNNHPPTSQPPTPCHARLSPLVVLIELMKGSRAFPKENCRWPLSCRSCGSRIESTRESDSIHEFMGRGRALTPGSQASLELIEDYPPAGLETEDALPARQCSDTHRPNGSKLVRGAGYASHGLATRLS